MQPSSQEDLGRALARMHLAEPKFPSFGLALTTRLGINPNFESLEHVDLKPY